MQPPHGYPFGAPQAVQEALPSQAAQPSMRHVCLSRSLACSRINPCEKCDVYVENYAFPFAITAAGLSVEQASAFYNAYKEAMIQLHVHMTNDPNISAMALDLNRVRLLPETGLQAAPQAYAPPQVAHAPPSYQPVPSPLHVPPQAMYGQPPTYHQPPYASPQQPQQPYQPETQPQPFVPGNPAEAAWQPPWPAVAPPQPAAPPVPPPPPPLPSSGGHSTLPSYDQHAGGSAAGAGGGSQDGAAAAQWAGGMAPFGRPVPVTPAVAPPVPPPAPAAPPLASPTHPAPATPPLRAVPVVNISPDFAARLAMQGMQQPLMPPDDDDGEDDEGDDKSGESGDDDGHAHADGDDGEPEALEDDVPPFELDPNDALAVEAPSDVPTAMPIASAAAVAIASSGASSNAVAIEPAVPARPSRGSGNVALAPLPKGEELSVADIAGAGTALSTVSTPRDIADEPSLNGTPRTNS